MFFIAEIFMLSFLIFFGELLSFGKADKFIFSGKFGGILSSAKILSSVIFWGILFSCGIGGGEILSFEHKFCKNFSAENKLCKNFSFVAENKFCKNFSTENKFCKKFSI